MNLMENIASVYYKVGDKVFARDFVKCRWFKGVIYEMVRDPMVEPGSNVFSPEEDGILYMVHLDNFKDTTLPLRLRDIRPYRDSCLISDLAVGENVLLNNNKDGSVDNTFWWDFEIQQIIPNSDTLIGIVHAVDNKTFPGTKVQCSRNIVKRLPYSLIPANGRRARSSTSALPSHPDHSAMETDDSNLSAITLSQVNGTSSPPSSAVSSPNVPRPQLISATALPNEPSAQSNEGSARFSGSGTHLNGPSPFLNDTSPQFNGTTTPPVSSGTDIAVYTTPSDANTSNAIPLGASTLPMQSPKINESGESKIGKIRVMSPARIRAMRVIKAILPPDPPESCSQCANANTPCPLCECTVCKAKVMSSSLCLTCCKCAQKCHSECAHQQFSLPLDKSTWMCPKCKSVLRAKQAPFIYGQQTSYNSSFNHGEASTSSSINTVSVESLRNLHAKSPYNLTVETTRNATIEVQPIITVETPRTVITQLPPNIAVKTPRNVTIELLPNITAKTPTNFVKPPRKSIVEPPRYLSQRNFTVESPSNSTIESPRNLIIESQRNLTGESSRGATVTASHSNNVIDTINENYLRKGIANGLLMENKIPVKSGTASVYKRVNGKCVAGAKGPALNYVTPRGVPAKSQVAKTGCGISPKGPPPNLNVFSISEERSLEKNGIANVPQQNHHLLHKTVSHKGLPSIPKSNSDTLGNVPNNDAGQEAKGTVFFKNIVNALDGTDSNYTNDIVLDRGFSISIPKTEPRDDLDLDILDLSNFTPNLLDWNTHMDVVSESDSRHSLSDKTQNPIPNVSGRKNGPVAAQKSGTTKRKSGTSERKSGTTERKNGTTERENGTTERENQMEARENGANVSSETIKSRANAERESVENVSPDDKRAVAPFVAVNQSSITLNNLRNDKSNLNKNENLSSKQAFHLSGRKKICTLVGPNHFGPIPGIEVGTSWRYRVQASEAGVHRPMIGGIAGRGCIGAYSIVLSGSYPDDYDNGDEFFYTGSGSAAFTGKNKRIGTQVQDQSLTRFNLALARSCNAPVDAEHGAESPCWQDGKPIRVIRTYKLAKMSQYAPTEGIRYDGIYKIVKYYPYRGTNGFLVWRYFMRRDDPTPAPWTPEGQQRIRELGLDKIIEPVIGDVPNMKRKCSKANENVKSSNAGEVEGLASLFNELNALPARKKLLLSNDAIDDFQLDEDIDTLISQDESNMALWNYCKTYLHQGRKKFLEIVADTFKCVLCDKSLDKPVTTPCCHLVCLACLTSEFGKEKYNCPTCQEEINVDFEVNINTTLDDALSKLFPS